MHTHNSAPAVLPQINPLTIVPTLDEAALAEIERALDAMDIVQPKVGKTIGADAPLAAPERTKTREIVGTSVRDVKPKSSSTDETPKTSTRIQLHDVELKTRSVMRPRTAMAPWEDLRPQGQFARCLNAMRGMGRAVAFTLNVSPAVAEKAIASGHPANYLSRCQSACNIDPLSASNVDPFRARMMG